MRDCKCMKKQVIHSFSNYISEYIIQDFSSYFFSLNLNSLISVFKFDDRSCGRTLVVPESCVCIFLDRLQQVPGGGIASPIRSSRRAKGGQKAGWGDSNRISGTPGNPPVSPPKKRRWFLGNWIQIFFPYQQSVKSMNIRRFYAVLNFRQLLPTFW